MKAFAGSLKRGLLTENPLLISFLGLSGAVVFTCDILSALTATVTSLLVLTAAVAAMHFFEKTLGSHGSNVVFFSVAVAVTAICGALTDLAFPTVWDKIGACYPLFPVGSLAFVTSRNTSGKILLREIETISITAGYGAAIVAISIIRQLLGWIPFVQSSGGALIIIGIAAAVMRAILLPPQKTVEKDIRPKKRHRAVVRNRGMVGCGEKTTAVAGLDAVLDEPHSIVREKKTDDAEEAAE